MIRPLQYVRYTVRQFRKSPGFTVVAVLTLALGIGATAAMYTVLYATIFAPMPYPHPEQLVMVWSKIGSDRSPVSAGDFLDWKQQSSAFQDLSAWSEDQFDLSTADHPEEVLGHLTTPGWFKMQGFHFFLGRDFLPEEAELGKEHEVILSNRLWQRLGANRNILGQQIRLNDEPYTVVGVLTAGVADRLPVALTVPLAFKPEQINHNFHWLTVMGRLKPGLSIAAAQADMDAIARRIGEAHPQSSKSWGVKIEPLRNDFIPRTTLLTLRLLMGAVGFVLLIACANMANLLLAKATTRQREVAFNRNDDHLYFSYPMYRDLRDQNSVLSGLVATAWVPVGVQWHNQPELDDAELVSGNYFDVLGVQPALGRLLVPSDERAENASPVVVLSFNYWQRRFGFDSRIMNRAVLINGHPFTIVGVAAQGFHSVVAGDHPEVFAPMAMKSEIAPTMDSLEERRSQWLNIIGRIRPGITREKAEGVWIRFGALSARKK